VIRPVSTSSRRDVAVANGDWSSGWPPSLDAAYRVTRATTSFVTSADSHGLRAPQSWDSMAGQAGSASVVCRSTQYRHGVLPGSTTGPMRTELSP